MSKSVPTDKVYLQFSYNRPAAPGWVLTFDPLLQNATPAEIVEGAGNLFIRLFGGTTMLLDEVDHLMYAPLDLVQRSNFNRVSTLNEFFGKLKGDPANIDWSAVDDQLNVVQEELAELTEAIQARDLGALRDGVCDVLVTTYGVGHLVGQPVDEDMKAVDASNLSKICTTEEELEETLRFYRDKIGIMVHSGGEPGAQWVKSSRSQVGSDGKGYSNNKFLKCINWHEPVFAPLFAEEVPA